MRWINRISALAALTMLSTARSTTIALMSNAPVIEAAAPRYYAPHPALLSPRQRRKLAPGRDVLSRRRVR